MEWFVHISELVCDRLDNGLHRNGKMFKQHLLHKFLKKVKFFMDKTELINEWITKAENDLLNVENNLNSKSIPLDTVCYHCQQAAEKYLKA